MRNRTQVCLVILSILSWGLWWVLDTKRGGAMVDAAACGDINTVRAYLDTGVPPDSRNEKGMTALMWAASNGRTDIARLLLDKGANPDPAVEYAVMGDHPNVLRMLLNAHAHLSAKDREELLGFARSWPKHDKVLVDLLQPQGTGIRSHD